VNNPQVARIFEGIAGLLEIKGEQRFTVVAYQRVARTIDQLPTELDQMLRDGQDLKAIPGIGKAISQKISELVSTGKLDFFERLRSEFPDGILEVMRVPGVGPKTAKRLWDELGVTNVSQLEGAVLDGSLASLPRMGKRKADSILQAVASFEKSDDRMPIARAMPAAERVVEALKETCPGIDRLVVAGSLRRFEETIGNINLVCTAADHTEVLEAMAGLPNVAQVLSQGDDAASVMLSEGLVANLRVVEDARFGAVLQHLTGNRRHNGMLKERAVELGLTLDDHGITDNESGVLEEIAGEEALYARLGLQYITPELRVGLGEIDDAANGGLPRLVELSDLRGDLHVHSDWSDGREPLELMVAGAKDRGYGYVAITDHSAGRGIANGLTPGRLESHQSELRRVEAAIGGIRVLSGSEVDIRADGSLDYSDEVLATLDWVVASIHSGLGQPRDIMTARIIKAMHNPHVTAIGHLSARRLGERKGIDADFEAIFVAAATTGTVLEINASPERLDLRDSHIQRARELGVLLAIDSDAHTVERLANQRYGVGIARRARCEAHHIVNTLPTEAFLDFLSIEKSRRREALQAYA
jgi:DNA polymerase (family 10)